MPFGIERGLLHEFVEQRFLLLILECDLIRLDLVTKNIRLSLQIKHVLILPRLCQGLSFTLELILCFNFLRAFTFRSSSVDCPFLLELVDELGPPSLRRLFMRTLNIITMRVWEGVESICLVEVLLHILEHFLLSNTLLHIFTMLCLLGSFLFLFDVAELQFLLLVTGVLVPLFLNLCHTFIGSGLSLGLCLLHVLFHEIAGIFARAFVEEQGALAFPELLVHEVVERHLW